MKYRETFYGRHTALDKLHWSKEIVYPLLDKIQVMVIYL